MMFYFPFIFSGPWRWFDESMLDCCEPLEKVKAEGISFGKVVCLAHCAGAEVQAFRTCEANVDQFRQIVQSCSASDGRHVISSYHRGIFKQVRAVIHPCTLTFTEESIVHLVYVVPSNTTVCSSSSYGKTIEFLSET